jgi:AraC-like DNA-binding protein
MNTTSYEKFNSLTHKQRASDMSQPADYMIGIADQLTRMGVDGADWLKSHDLTYTQLVDPQLVLPITQFRKIVLSAMQSCTEPALGLLVGQSMSMQNHGLLGLAAQKCSNLWEVILLLESFIGIRTPMVSVHHEKAHQKLKIKLEEKVILGAIRRPVLETILITIKNCFDTLLLGKKTVHQVFFPLHQPSYSDLAEQIFGCEIIYEQTWCGLVISLDDLMQPLNKVELNSLAEVTQLCHLELYRLTQQNSLSNRIRILLFNFQLSGFPNLTIISRMVNLTPRTLHRNLVAEGTSFSEILSGVKNKLALFHLEFAHFSVQEIAFILGYSDVANFRRAFKKLNKITPIEFRDNTKNKK